MPFLHTSLPILRGYATLNEKCQVLLSVVRLCKNYLSHNTLMAKDYEDLYEF